MKKKLLNLLLFISIPLFIFGGVGCALGYNGVSIGVKPLILRFAKDDNFKDLEVFNPTEQTQYVKITPKVVVISKNKAKEVTIKDPKKLGLLVTPAKLVLGAKQSKFVRVMLTKHAGAVERHYIISVLSMIGKIVYPKVNGKVQKKAHIALKMIIGYGVRAIVNPQIVRTNVSAKRHGKYITIDNKSNVSIVVFAAKQCIPSQKSCNEFKKFKSVLAYAGQKVTFEVPKAFKTEFNARIEGNIVYPHFKFFSN